MIGVKQDFEDRVKEINLLFDFLKKSELDNAQIMIANTIKPINSDLISIFRANGLLMLYNLSESCIINAIEQIYIHIDSNSIDFNQLRDSIKTEIISSIKNNQDITPKKLVLKLNYIAQDIALESFDRKKLFSGNLHAGVVKELALKYGFDCRISAIKDEDGKLNSFEPNILKTVMRKRNDLAHGEYSFKDCGKNYSIQDLIHIKNQVISYLRQILEHIENYINDRKYLENR